MIPLSSITNALLLPRYKAKLFYLSPSLFLNRPPHKVDPRLPKEASSMLTFIHPSERGFQIISTIFGVLGI